MATVNVQSNIAEIAREVAGWRTDQVPFASSRALNDSTFQVRTYQVTTGYAESFRVVQRNFARAAFRVRTSTRRNLTSALYDQLEREFLSLQVESGIRLPRSGLLAIPTRNVRRTPTGRLMRADLPGTPGIFRMVLRGRPALWRRKRDNSLELMYVLEPEANIPGQYDFYTSSIAEFDRVFPDNFRRRFGEAIASAR